jgi:hypothetical protein
MKFSRLQFPTKLATKYMVLGVWLCAGLCPAQGTVVQGGWLAGGQVPEARISVSDMRVFEDDLEKSGGSWAPQIPSPWVPMGVADDFPQAGHSTSKSISTWGVLPDPEAPFQLISDFSAIAPGTFEPPDTHGAVGPNHLMVSLNDRVRFTDKSGTVLESVTLQAFWSVLGFTDVFDPKTVYDPLSGRFYTVTCAARRSGASSLLFGVSETSDPTGNWILRTLDGDPEDSYWVDFPNIGLTDGLVTLTANMFNISGDTSGGVNIWVFDKTTVVPSGSLIFSRTRVTDWSSTVVPAMTLDPAETTQYLINVQFSLLGRLQLHTITGMADNPVLTSTVATPSSETWRDDFDNAPQLGSTDTVRSNDGRIMNALVRNGSLWCTHMAGLPISLADRVTAKWWEINVDAGRPGYALGETVQSGNIDGNDSFGNPMNFIFPSIAVNSQDDVVVGFSGTSLGTYVGCYYASRRASTPAGFMEEIVEYKGGEGAYGGTRWGDYSATCIDPENFPLDVELWTLQEYAISSDTYGIWWARVSPGDGAIEGEGEDPWSGDDVPLSTVPGCLILACLLIWLAIVRLCVMKQLCSPTRHN